MRSLSRAVVGCLTAVALVTVLAPAATALPLPVPVAGVEPLLTEGVIVEGPLVNNLTLPSLK
ncbi:hypothetical protein GCM10010451_64900 [Streptomyces virens]|uniref:Secreted protein n=2 Tax=Streptomyces TaxID=1883 RepID=A0AA40VJF4_9ACTN|nr:MULTISPECIES: hypothetical protein [Streptomyces]MBA8946250.1 hypothetical protein [Streptomyces calvus]MBA8977679.1 hypothetical protein [Streptomyces calvus]MYS28586.1 hypothetical protein [Streptomyces sp. SID7804]GGP49291.1 hypothetical protein GCM10010247_22490 [Streptomyces calvus]